MDLTYLNNTSIELVRAVDGQNIRHAVLDFDGTLSLIRDGWQNVMVPMMVEILAQTPAIETEQQLEAIVVEFVDRLTGKQTIYQMMQLVKEVERRKAKAESPLDYKDLYNRRLLPIVNQRISGLVNGSIESDSLRVPFSIELLQKLQECSISIPLCHKSARYRKRL